jgi:ribose transport system substrate-binding protein
MVKRIVSIALVAALATGLVFAQSGKQLRIAFVSPFIGHPYWVTVSDGVKKASDEIKANTSETGPIGEVNIDTQIQAIETAIASKVDGILTMALNPTAFTPVINKAVAAGIPVVLIDTDAPLSKRNVYAGTSNRDAGFAVGQALVKATGGKARIGIITGAIDADNLNQRIDGFKDAIKAQAGMKIVDLQAGNSDLLLATEKAQAMLQAHPEITAMYGTSAECAAAIGKIVQEKALVGKVTIFGFDDLDQTLDFIRKGVVFGTAVQKNYMMGYMGIKLIADIKAGKAPAKQVIDTGVTIVTKANVETYKNN